MNRQLFDTFLSLTRQLNEDFGIVPLLYGSLGLEAITGEELSPLDIDLLVPEMHLTDGWSELELTMTGYGYELVDLHEHEFTNGVSKAAFARLEELETFAGIGIGALETVEREGARYRQLKLEQFLHVYRRSALDGYRGTKKNGKDADKIRLIEDLLQRKGISSV